MADDAGSMGQADTLGDLAEGGTDRMIGVQPLLEKSKNVNGCLHVVGLSHQKTLFHF